MISLGILFSFISLTILSWIIFSSTKAPFLRMLKTRRTNIKETIHQSRRALNDAKNMCVTFRDKLTGVEKERSSMVSQMKIDLQKMRERMIQDANDLGGNIRVTAKRTSEQEFRAAKARLRWQIASAAINLAREKLEKHLTKDDDFGLQEETLTNLEQSKYGKSITSEALRESII
ncbi:MAG: hypothetical protein A3F16_02665 [Deltaproteobacteria bacterium RIFCSPHIGHO2_12_FULL_43_9]|nr:MAG: hypothetical protein A3F16_02665 [Deltaproteobacteria bacterium RIFCSPHIGHO2_12_FULL_43_9]